MNNKQSPKSKPGTWTDEQLKKAVPISMEVNNIRCPFCNRIKAVVKHQDDDRVYHCTHCDKLFDLQKE